MNNSKDFKTEECKECGGKTYLDETEWCGNCYFIICEDCESGYFLAKPKELQLCKEGFCFNHGDRCSKCKVPINKDNGSIFALTLRCSYCQL